MPKPLEKCPACRIGITVVSGDRSCWHDHDQVLISIPEWDTDEWFLVNVDIAMAYPLGRLWDAGVRTYNSCQGCTEERFFDPLLAGMSRPYVQVGPADVEVTERILTEHFGTEWMLEVVPPEFAGGSTLACVVPKWAAENTRKVLAERAR